jgi:hypothetical protein
MATGADTQNNAAIAEYMKDHEGKKDGGKAAMSHSAGARMLAELTSTTVELNNHPFKWGGALSVLGYWRAMLCANVPHALLCWLCTRTNTAIGRLGPFIVTVLAMVVTCSAVSRRVRDLRGREKGHWPMAVLGCFAAAMPAWIVWRYLAMGSPATTVILLAPMIAIGVWKGRAS